MPNGASVAIRRKSILQLSDTNSNTNLVINETNIKKGGYHETKQDHSRFPGPLWYGFGSPR